ncbi:DUF2586 domain-containing protein [Actinobacillus porcinus]|uniref:DUF2586 domain-containing protein n=1 Tax=Actinobacillus porcinus TaxID=51048 RepID=UPI002A914F4E|nr:DUF2586 domain-containing protein [Actinobacillus porcinus]MDY6216672.1 DUF2586 domain-containing protein [Actinobacillus porcinus]
MSKLPSVTVNTLNLKSGTTAQIEKTALFLGVGKNAGRLTSVNADSDLEKLFGADSDLTRQLYAAQLNAGQNWLAYVYEMTESDYDITKGIMAANALIRYEFVVNTRELGATKATLNELQECSAALVAKYGRRTFSIQAVRGISASTETWSAYLSAMKEITKGVACDHVMVVPELFGNDVGVLAGRLCSSAVTIADTPARVKTGAVVGLKNADLPVDSENTRLDLSHIATLADYRFSSVMWYPDYDGYYWSKGLTLDADGGDYQLIEYVRVVDKAARKVRLKAIAKIGDRSFNSTTASTELHKTYFAQVLREMAISTQIGTEYFPGECYPPTEDSIAITWHDKNTVSIYLRVRPIDCPTDITTNILLDLTTLGDSNE